jgi:predicted dehydrogenase
MTSQFPIRVGIIGVHPNRWSATAHIPALLKLPQLFKITGIANTSLQSAQNAVNEIKELHDAGVTPFGSVNELVQSDQVDMIIVTVKVPHHADLVRAALNANKHVFCEWPLGNGLVEARELATLAKTKTVKCIIGTQAVFAPQIEKMKQLITDGYIGKPLSTTIVGTGGAWGATTDRANAYTDDIKNGATMLSIPVGHVLAPLQMILGQIESVNAVLAHGRTEVTNYETGEKLPLTSHDQVLISGTLSNGVPISIHYRGGVAHGSGSRWEVNGTDGELRINAGMGHFQLTPLTLEGANGDANEFKSIDVSDSSNWNAMVDNVRRVYETFANDLKSGNSTLLDFDFAVQLHQVVAAVEKAAQTGQRVRVQDM